MNPLAINVLVLAYLGDTIYENYIRKHLIMLGINKVDDLQKQAVSYVSAKNQASFIKKMIEEDFFDEEELSVIMRARNNTNSRHPKNCDVVTYKYATALEAVIGYLDIVQKKERIDSIMDYILR